MVNKLPHGELLGRPCIHDGFLYVAVGSYSQSWKKLFKTQLEPDKPWEKVSLPHIGNETLNCAHMVNHNQCLYLVCQTIMHGLEVYFLAKATGQWVHAQSDTTPRLLPPDFVICGDRPIAISDSMYSFSFNSRNGVSPCRIPNLPHNDFVTNVGIVVDNNKIHALPCASDKVYTADFRKHYQWDVDVIPKTPFSDCGGVMFNKELVVAGGLSRSSEGGVRDVFVLDGYSQSRRWCPLPPLVEPMSRPFLLAHERDIYCIDTRTLGIQCLSF